MELEDFVSHFREQFEGAEADAITADTRFKELGGWTSMTSLAVIAMVDDEYDVQVQGRDLRECGTVADLYRRVQSLLD